MKIITKDETPHSIQILSDAGENISRSVSAVDIRIRPHALVMAHVSLLLSEVDLDGIKSIFTLSDPKTGIMKQVKKVEFTDGTIWETK